MNRKSSFMVVVMNGVAMVANILYLSSNASNTIMSPFYPYAYLLVTTMWNFSW